MGWENVNERKQSIYYSVLRSTDCNENMSLLRKMFPDGEANELNFCLFSTSGVHGLGNTIEEAEDAILNEGEDKTNTVTFLVIHPRVVTMRYGNVYPESADDFAFLKKLRESSHRAVAGIGVHNAT